VTRPSFQRPLRILSLLVRTFRRSAGSTTATMTAPTTITTKTTETVAVTIRGGRRRRRRRQRRRTAASTSSPCWWWVRRPRPPPRRRRGLALLLPGSEPREDGSVAGLRARDRPLSRRGRRGFFSPSSPVWGRAAMGHGRRPAAASLRLAAVGGQRRRPSLRPWPSSPWPACSATEVG
jgi:hypothetical protein